MQYLSEFVYDKIWSELSLKDRQVAIGIAQVPDGKILDIRNLLDMETNEFNPYRKRLIKKGILSGDMFPLLCLCFPNMCWKTRKK